MREAEEVVAFIRAHLGAVYTLELLMMVKRGGDKAWNTESLVRELRSSATAVNEALNRLARVGFVLEKTSGSYVFHPASPELKRLADDIEKLYTNRPVSLVTAIVAAAPSDKLRLFSDAFKIKE